MSQMTPTTSRYQLSDNNLECIDDIISMPGMEVRRPVQFGGDSPYENDANCVSEYVETDIKNPESLEEDAVLGFFEKFHKVYGDDRINFQLCSLRQAIGYSCLAPEDERKGLLLYLHKDNDEFSQMICEHFADSDSGISNILETSFDVLPWDLDIETNGALETAVDKWPKLTAIKKCIKKKRSSLFILTSVECTVTVFAKFDSNNNNADHILSTLKSIKGVVFEPQVVIELQNDYTTIIGAKEYHKIMYDKLGDRDYDFFEADEHDALKQKIGFSKFGAPSTEDGYDAKQIQAIENTYEAVMIQSNKYSEWQDCVTISFVFNCLKPLPSEVEKRKKEDSDYVEDMDIMPIPVYIIPKCSSSSDPCRIIIDHDNRVYESWSDYIECNKLHKCMMIVPKNGRYKKINDEVSLSEHYSPACAVEQDILKGADITSVISNLPPTPTPTVENTKALTSEIISVLTSAISFENYSKVISIANTLRKEGATADAFVSVLRKFQPEIRDKIIQVFMAFIKEVDMRKIRWFKICEDAWEGSCKNVVTLELIVEFLNEQVSLYESDFCKRYGDKKYNIAKKTTYWLSHVMNMFAKGPNDSRHKLQMLVDWMIKKSINSLEYSSKLRKRIPNAKKENSCTICIGTFTTI